MSESGEKRRLAAILAADIVGYSRMMAADESGTLSRLKALRTEMLDGEIAAHNGRIVKTTGDGFLVEFASVVDAVRCAVEVQSAMAARAAGLSEDKRMLFRIGVNLGDIIAEGDDIFGDGVNVAARLEGIAKPGGICISRAARDQVRDKLEHALEDLGEVEVKNIPRPVRIFQIVFDGAARTAPNIETAAQPDAAVDADKPSIIVLPFDNMSQDPEQEYFSDGITEDIITDLGKASGLFVIARNSAFFYKGKSFKVPDVCREFGVKFALEGSIRKAGNRVRITAQLIDGASGGHLWAERYDRDLTDIFEVQDDVTQQIVGALKVTLNESEKSLIAGGGTTSTEAHDLYLKGREVIWGAKKGRERFEEACTCFRRAIALDADYALPRAGLAGAYLLDYQNRWSAAPEDSIDEADRLIGEAIALDDKEPFAHLVASMVATFKKDLARAARAADTALSLNPNYAQATGARGAVFIYAGEPDKAIPYIEQTIRLDPASRDQYLHFLATAYFVAGDYVSAAEHFRARISANPATDLSRALLAATLGHLDQAEEAGQIWRELMEINPQYSATGHIGRLPFANPQHAEKIREGLRKAGVAD